MPFKPSDLKPVVIMASSGLLLGVNPKTGIKSFGNRLSQGRQKTLNVSSAGNGSPGHLAAAILSSSTPMKTLHIPYRGNRTRITRWTACRWVRCCATRRTAPSGPCTGA